MTQGVCEAGCNQEEGSRQERGVHDRGRGNGVGGRNWGRDGTGQQMRSKCEYSLLKFSIYLYIRVQVHILLKDSVEAYKILKNSIQNYSHYFWREFSCKIISLHN